MWTRQVRTTDNWYHWVNSTISLVHFVVKIRKQNGEEFEPDTLTSISRSFDRFLREQGKTLEPCRENKPLILWERFYNPCLLSPAIVSQREYFRERHSRTAPSLLPVKEISKKARRNGSSEFFLLTLVTKISRQCPFLVIVTCRTLRGTLNYFKLF